MVAILIHQMIEISPEVVTHAFNQIPYFVFREVSLTKDDRSSVIEEIIVVVIIP